MKLVYLDTSNLSLLSETRQKFPERFQSFLKTWRKQNYILALSEANIFEIARKGFNKSRYDLLTEMRPIRFEGRTFPKEIISAFKRKGIHNFLIRNYEFCKPMFSEVIYSTDRLYNLCNPAEDVYPILANQSYELSDISWQSKKNHPLDKNHKKIRLGDLPESSIELKNYLKRVLHFLERDGVNHAAIKQLKFLYSRIDEVGLKQACAELTEIDINNNRNLNKSLDFLFDRLLFKNSVNSLLSQMLYESEKAIDFLTSKISIEDCRGEWLKRQVEYQLHKSGDFETNNEMDIKHISHLPYVGILITDKRIVDKTTQVFRSKELLESLKTVALPKKFSNSIESLENALFN